MVDVSGHFAMALLFAAPAWLVWGRRGSLTFAAFTLVTAMLPDTDLALRHVFPTVHHHGVTHTVVFVTVASVVAGAITARLLTSKRVGGYGAAASVRRLCSCSQPQGS